MPALLWKDGASRTIVWAGAGREWGSSLGEGEGFLSVCDPSEAGSTHSVQSGLRLTGP